MPTVPSMLFSSDNSTNIIDRQLPLFVRQCVQTYAADWVKVHYKYAKYGATYRELIERPADLLEHIYEVDADAEVRDVVRTR